jgi:hypothetical protein
MRILFIFIKEICSILIVADAYSRDVVVFTLFRNNLTLFTEGELYKLYLIELFESILYVNCIFIY